MNLCIVIARSMRPVELLASLAATGYVNESVTAETALANDNVIEFVQSNDGVIGIIGHDQWAAAVMEPSAAFDEAFSEYLLTLSRNRDVFMMLTQSSTGGLWFELCRQGQRVRQWIEIESQVVSNTGTPLNAQDAKWFSEQPDEGGERDFWKLVEMAESAFDFKWGDLNKAGGIYRLALD